MSENPYIPNFAMAKNPFISYFDLEFRIGADVESVTNALVAASEDLPSYEETITRDGTPIGRILYSFGPLHKPDGLEADRGKVKFDRLLGFTTTEMVTKSDDAPVVRSGILTYIRIRARDKAGKRGVTALVEGMTKSQQLPVVELFRRLADDYPEVAKRLEELKRRGPPNTTPGNVMVTTPNIPDDFEERLAKVPNEYQRNIIRLWTLKGLTEGQIQERVGDKKVKTTHNKIQRIRRDFPELVPHRRDPITHRKLG